MLFNSATYIFLFLPVTFGVYLALRRMGSGALATKWLVLASLFFYGWWNPIYLGLIISSVVVNFTVGRLLNRHGTEEAGETPDPRRKYILICGIAFNIGLLGYFKYADFFIDTVNVVLGTSLPVLNLVLPLAISFFTFQQVAYLVDSYKFPTTNYDLSTYALFVTFFPQLIAGPIVRHGEMLPQFARLKDFRLDNLPIPEGVFIFILGLSKKVILGDTCAVWANAGFDSLAPLDFAEAWVTSLSYTFQLYFDFSGYTDMAIGAALLFGIRLPINFDSPYKVLNIRDFWRRWHITLSGWMRDYLYVPLGGNRKGNNRTMVNLWITFLLTGLWHGAGWTFVLWGAVHGVGLTIHRFWRRTGLHLPSGLAWLLTFGFVSVAWVLFRAESIDGATNVLRGMLGLSGFGLPRSIRMEDLAMVPVFRFEGFDFGWGSAFHAMPFLVICAVIAFAMPNSIQMIGMTAYEGRFKFRKTGWVAIICGLLAGLCMIFLLGSASKEFIYFNF